MAWIDYQKAFDSVFESWIIKSLELIGINNKTISFTKKTTSYGKKNMSPHTEGKPIEHKVYKYDAEYFKETRYYYCYFALAQSSSQSICTS